MLYDVIFKSGIIGLLLWIILFLTSTVAMAIAIRCWWLLRRKRFKPEFVNLLMPYFQAQDWNGAYTKAQQDSSVTARIAFAILSVAYCKTKAERLEIATAALDKEARAVQRQLSSLSTCGNIAPMEGLLGTVTGMVDAFTGLGTAIGPEKASILAISISHSLYTTAAGLLIAIPAIILVVFFRNQMERRMEELADAVEKILDAIPEA
jgi:biopolymer transport protein ExbB